MTGSTTLALVIFLGMTTMASVICLTILVLRAQDSQGKHSVSTARIQERSAQILERTVDRSVEVVKIQAGLTETLLMGREVPQTSLQVPSESTSETSPRLDTEWLPDHIKDAIERDRLKENVWPDLSEPLPPDSTNGWGAPPVPDLDDQQTPLST